MYYCCLGGSSQEIVNKKIRPLFGLMSAGAKFFNWYCIYVYVFKHCHATVVEVFCWTLFHDMMFSFSLGVKNQKEAESLWEQFFQWVWNVFWNTWFIGQPWHSVVKCLA